MDGWKAPTVIGAILAGALPIDGHLRGGDRFPSEKSMVMRKRSA
jgi:hypothetical protein